jgi:hypothetical protein
VYNFRKTFVIKTNGWIDEREREVKMTFSEMGRRGTNFVVNKS